MSFILRARVKLALWRRRGLLEAFFCGGLCCGTAWSVVSECCGGGGRCWRAWVMLLLMAAASKGLPTSSSAVRSECCELAAEGPLAEVNEKAGFEVWRRTTEGGEGEGCGGWWAGTAPRRSALRCWWKDG